MVVNIIQLMALYKTGYTTLVTLVINWITGLNVYKAWYMMHNVMSAMAASVRWVWQLLVVSHSYGTRAFRTNANLIQCIVDGIDSLRPNDTYMHSDNHFALFEPMVYYFQWEFYRKGQSNCVQNSNIFIKVNALEIVVWKMSAILSRPQCVNPTHLRHDP